MSNQSYDFNLSVGIQEILDTDSAAKVESQVQKQKQRMEEPVEIKVELNIGDAKAQIKELQKEMTVAANNIQKIKNKKRGLGKSDYNDIAKYNDLLDSNQRKIDGIVAQLKSQGVAVRTTTKEYKALQSVLEEIGYVEKKKKTSAPRKNATSEVKQQTEAEKQHTKAAESAAEAIQKITDVSKQQADASMAAAQAADKQTDALKKQEKAIKKLAQAQNVDVKTKEKQLKLNKARLDDGRIIPQTYTIPGTKYQVDKGDAGWNLYESNKSGGLDYVATYETLNEVRRDAALIAEQEAAVQKNIAGSIEQNTQVIEENTKAVKKNNDAKSQGNALNSANKESTNVSDIKKQTDAINELANAQQKLQERQANLQHGNEKDYFRKGGFYSGKKGRLALARNVAYDISEFNLSNSDLDKLVESTYDEFSKIKNLLVDRQTWINEIQTVLRGSELTKQLAAQYSTEQINEFRRNDDVLAAYEQVRSGALSIADALEKVKKISAELNATPKETSAPAIQEETAALKENTDAVNENVNAKESMAQISQNQIATRLAEFDKEQSSKFADYIPIDKYKEQFNTTYNDLRQKVADGILSVSQALEEVGAQYVAISELVAAEISEQEAAARQAQKIAIPKLTSAEHNTVFGDKALDNILKDYNLPQDIAFKVADMFKDAISIERAIRQDSEQNGASNFEVLNGQLNGCVQEITDTLMKFGTTVIGTDTELKKFHKDMKGRKIRYNDAQKAEFGDDWKYVSKRFRSYLTQDPSALSVDAHYMELLSEHRGLLDENTTNDSDQLRQILALLEQAIDSSKNGYKKRIAMSAGDRPGLQGFVNQTISDLTDRLPEATKLLDTEQQIVGAIEQGNEAREKSKGLMGAALSGLEGAEDAEKVIEPIVSAYRELEDVIGVISSAAGKDAATKFLSGMTDQSQFKDRLSDYFGTVLQDAGPWRLKSGKGAIVTQDDVATVHLFNEVTQDTVDLVFQLQDGMLKLAKGPKFGLNNAAPFDLESAKKLAEIQIRDLEANLGGRAYDGMGQLKGALNNIADPKTLEEFNNQLKIAKEEVKALKKEYAAGSGSLNDFSRAGTVMRNSTEEIAKLQDQLKLVGDVEGVERATDALGRMKDAAQAFNEAQNEAGQKTAYQQYNEAHSDYNASYERAKRAQQVASAEAKAEAQQVEQENQKIQQYYQSILDTVNKINGLDSKINEMKIKDGGTGLYSGVIQSLESDKSQLVDRLHQISNDINQEFQGIFTLTGDVKLPMGTFLDDLGNTPIPSTLSDFLNDTRTQAALTTEQMDKLVASFKNSQNIKFDLQSKIVTQINAVSNAIEQLRAISDPSKTDSILSRDSKDYQALAKYFNQEYSPKLEAISKKDVSQLSAQEIGDFAQAANNVLNYSKALQQAAEQEAKYFSGKTKYKTGDTMYGDPNGAFVTLGESAKNIDPAREKLEKFVAEFTKGQGVITNFVTSANGISKVDFSTFDEATGQLRTFTAEMGKSTGNIFYDETSMKGLTAGTTAAKQSVESLSAAYAKLKQMESSGFDVSQYTSSAMSQIQKLNEALGSVGNNKNIASQNMLKNMAAEANKTAQEIAKLEQGWLKVQAAINSGQVKQLGVADKSGNIEAQLTNMAQMSETARGATFAVQSFNAQTNTLTYTLTTGNGTVRTMTASMDALTGTVVENAGKVSQMQTAWGKFTNSFSGIGRKIKNYMGYMLSVHSVIRVFRNGLKSVLEIDSALLELKKVTNETEATYSKFLDTMAQSGAKVGSTIKDLTTSAADWARLGYSIQEAGKLAENTMMLMNVSEFDNVSDATDSLISAIQAFKTDGEDVGAFSLEIIDEMNEVGNNYAISTSDLASSLTRSSAALVAANNSLEESIALTTAANTTIQNPEAVGNALKTVSMRIRGVKTE